MSHHFALLLLVAALPCSAEDLRLTTHDGRVIEGRVVSESSRGYLIAGPNGSEVVDFATIAQLEPRPPPTDFHLGVTVGAMSYGLLTTGVARLDLDWTFGRVGLRVSPGAWFYGATGFTLGDSSATYAVLGVDTKVLFHLGAHFALGLWLELGGAIGGSTELFAGPSFAPVVVTLGERGQHQLSLEASLPLLHLSLRPFEGASFGLPMAALGYTYLF